MLGDSLKSLLIGKSQEKWDLVLLQIVRAYRSTPHSSILETPNFLMFGRGTRVPEHVTYHVLATESNVDELIKRIRTAHEVLLEQQWQVKSNNSSDPPLYQLGDWVWMTSLRRQREQVAKLQSKFVGPYCVIEVMPNHTYKVERLDQVSNQNEARLKLYRVSPDAMGQPRLLELVRHPTMRGRGMAYRKLEGVQQDQEGGGRRVDRPAPAALPQEEAGDRPVRAGPTISEAVRHTFRS